MVTAALGGLVLGAVLTMFVNWRWLDRYEYHIWRWEADNITSVIFARLGIGPNPSEDQASVALERYFDLTSRLRGALESGDFELAEEYDRLRRAHENTVERILQRRISDAVAAAGLQRSLPLFSSVNLTWPPVALEFTTPPQLLVVSPRDRILRQSDLLLRNDLTPTDVQAIEARVDDADRVSLVVSVGGIAAYPAILRDDRSYESMLETASHEWVHHYLAFYPLGRTWGSGGDSHALNETTANIAGRAIAQLVRELYPVALPAGADGRAPPAPAATIDFGKEMRALRLEVDALLADGKVAEAESAMEQRRQHFAANGIYIRKINQAYFAFYGTYADSPASSDPIGPKVERVWELTGDVGTFLAVMREVRNVPDLDTVLRSLEALAR
jgi:hypothetical protein